MLMRLAGAAFIGLVLVAAPAEARRLFWWENAATDDSYSDMPSDQEAYAQDQFNQDQYDLYMQQMHKKKRKPNYDQSYYDPQLETPVYKPKVYKPKKKVVTQAAVPDVIIPKPPVKQPAGQKPSTAQTASIGNRFQKDAPSKSIDCSKGAAIVSGYGFSSVTTKTCVGATYTYGAIRSGSNFEIQVSSASGELTAVKKL